MLPAWFKSKGFWNLPNTITVVRFLLVPVMVALLWDEPGPITGRVACFLLIRSEEHTSELPVTL